MGKGVWREVQWEGYKLALLHYGNVCLHTGKELGPNARLFHRTVQLIFIPFLNFAFFLSRACYLLS